MLNQVFLCLISDNFDEMYVSYFYRLINFHPPQLTLVSNRRSLVISQSGLCVKADKNLSQLVNDEQFDCLILAEGQACITQLFSDPRVFELLKFTADSGKSIIVGPQGFKALKELPLWSPSVSKRVSQVELPAQPDPELLTENFVKV